MYQAARSPGWLIRIRDGEGWLSIDPDEGIDRIDGDCPTIGPAMLMILLSPDGLTPEQPDDSGACDARSEWRYVWPAFISVSQ